MGDRRARVTAAYATVRVLDPASGKPTVYGFYEGGILPPSADPESVEGLVRRGYAEWVDEPAEPEPVEVDPGAGAADTGTDQPPADPRPANNAPKPEWVAYAVTQRAEGVSEEDARAAAEGKSKADLVAEYGG